MESSMNSEAIRMAAEREWNAERMFELYVHDYMKKKNMHSTAEIFKREANIADHTVGIESKEGLLYEWWTVFSAIFASRQRESEEDKAEDSLKPLQIGEQRPDNRAVAPPVAPTQQVDPVQIPMSNDFGDILETPAAISSEMPPIGQTSMDILPSFGQFGLNDAGFSLPVSSPSGDPNKAISTLRLSEPPMDILPSFGQFGLNEADFSLPTSLPSSDPYKPVTMLPLSQSSMDSLPSFRQFDHNEANFSLPILSLSSDPYKPTSMLPLSQSSMDNQPSLGQFGLNEADFSFPILSASIGPYKPISMPPLGQSSSDILPSFSQFGLKETNISYALSSPSSDPNKTISIPHLSHSSMDILPSFGQSGLNKANSSYPFSSPSSNLYKTIPMPPRILDQLKNGNQTSLSRSTSNDVSVYLSSALPAQGIRDAGTSDRLNLGSLSGWPLNAFNNQQQNPIFPLDHEQRHFSHVKPLVDYNYSKSNPMLTRTGPTGDLDQIAALFSLEQRTQSVLPPRPSLRNPRKKRGPSNLKPGKNTKFDAKLGTENSTGEPDNSVSTQASTENKLQGLNLEETHSIHTSKQSLSCCDFSLDAKFLAIAGSEGKVFVWNTESYYSTSPAEQHSRPITDVRFRPNTSMLVTSSLDGTMKIWDATRPNKTYTQLFGHRGPVMSLDFHPRKVDILCSCDGNGEIRLWNFSNPDKIRTVKVISSSAHLGSAKQVRFQPGYEMLVAAASGKVINIFDVESSNLLFTLKGHVKDILSVTWDNSGARILSVSEDSARLWSILTAKCLHEFQADGNRFESGTFHPRDQSIGIIGGCKTMELWDPSNGGGKKSILAHEDSVTALAQSGQTMMIASASKDSSVKLWK